MLILSVAILALAAAASGQDKVRSLQLDGVKRVEVVNHFGKVTVMTVPGGEGEPVAGELRIVSAEASVETDVKVEQAKGRTAVVVGPANKRARVDLTLTVPERIYIDVTTGEGAVTLDGNFTEAKATTDTGTIAANVPVENLRYAFRWTQAKPRVLSDIEIPEPKELSGGRFQIKGATQSSERSDSDARKFSLSELDFTTGRGIILLNVPPGEVGSDLRERPLTNAAKAIIRSGDSLLMEAMRRAAPKYFGEYARSLPPIILEPRLKEKEAAAETRAHVKRALVRVTDLNNRAVMGLQATDFNVAESGAAREVISVRPSEAPFNLVLLLDVSGSVENYVNFIRKTARNFVDTVDERDKISIIIFNDDVNVVSGFTRDKQELSAKLDTFDAGGGTAFYDALAYTVSDTLRPIRGERSAIVILTDGDDNRSFLAFDSLTGSIQESGALIYPLYVPSGLIAAEAGRVSADIDPLRKRYMSLSAKSSGEGERLAKISGGVFFPISEIGQIQKAYTEIVRQLRSGYEVIFRSEASDDGVSPKLRIKASRPSTFTAVQSVSIVEN